MRQIPLFLSLLLLAPLAHLAAQEASPLAPGARVRVTTSTFSRTTWSQKEEEMEGTFVVLNADSLVLKMRGRNAPLSVPLARVTRLDVSLGKASRGEHAMKGAGVGFLFGGVIVGTLGALSHTSGEEDNFSRRDLFSMGFLLGCIPGALIGGGIGASTGGERWKRVPLERVRLSVAPQRGGGVRLAASFKF